MDAFRAGVNRSHESVGDFHGGAAASNRTRARLIDILAKRVAAPIRNLLLPLRCANCDQELEAQHATGLICSQCRAEWIGPAAARCLRCAEPLAGGEHAGCRACLERQPAFERAWTLGNYAGELRSATLRIKRSGAEPLAAAMAELFYLEAGDAIREWSPDAVLPVPMHWLRRWLRGTNSAETLASVLADRLGLPHVVGCMVRVRHTRAQSGLAPGERLRNVRGAFRLRKGVNLAGVRILLIDDILTTGATCGEIARVLARAGASATAVGVAARAADAGKR